MSEQQDVRLRGTGRRERGYCPDCGRMVCLRKDGRTRSHRARMGGYCLGGATPHGMEQALTQELQRIAADRRPTPEGSTR